MNVGTARITSRPWRNPPGYTPNRRHIGADGRTNSIAIWLALSGLLLPPPQMQFYIAGAKLTPGRLAIILLFLPGLFALLRRGRHLLASDAFASATGAWMIIAAIHVGTSDSFSSATAECIEFLGAYIVARGLIFGPNALGTFVRVLKLITVLVIIFAIVDRISHQYLIQQIAAAVFHTSAPPPLFRNGVVRAMSTLDHPILLGTFCALVPAILLYFEPTALRRFFWCSLCFLGCYLSQSSAAVLGFLIAVAVYSYDRMLKSFPWRWQALWAVLAGLILVLFIVSDHPFESLIYHFTLDRQTGYFRIMIWETATPIISQSPFIGYGFQLFNDVILDTTVDSVWLVLSLRFGLPMVALLFLTNIASLWPTRRTAQNTPDDLLSAAMRPAFSTVLMIFMFIGFTVHYWNYIWIFWGLCIGIRASLRELSLQRRDDKRRVPPSQFTKNSAAFRKIA